MRAPGAQGAGPHPLAQRMDQRLQAADMPLAHLLKHPPERALIGQALPTGYPAQHLVGPQRHALTEAARPADQAHHHQERGVAELVEGVRRARVLST